MSSKDTQKFFNAIKKSKTEEDVKNAYAKFFDITYDTSDRHDLYTPKVLFEFKFDTTLPNIKVRAQVLAQTLYYVRRLKFGNYIDKAIPTFLCLADQSDALITETASWRIFYIDEQGKYDWDLAPSNPDKQLVADLAETKQLQDTHIYSIEEATEFTIFAEQLNKCLQSQVAIAFEDKKIITETNFEEVFEYWNKIFGDLVRNGTKTSRYFVSDIQQDNTIFLKEQSRALFRVGQIGEIREKKILSKDYEHFWSLYEKVSNVDTIRAILAKIDRLTDETMRRFHGEFFTPLRFAQKALDYIEKTVGKQWWLSGEYRLWDMAAGTGNLEYYLPQSALPYCYLSTLYKEDTEHLQKLFADATVFQYDYLNDDIENVFVDKTGLNFELTWKMPPKLRKDLENPTLKWIILINPPFATSQKAGTSGGSKKDVSDTRLRKMMHKHDFGEVSRELAMQFVFRIKKEFEQRAAYFGLFYKIKHLNSNNDQKLRDTIFKFKYEHGFVFSSANFSGTSQNSPFPIAFMLWDLSSPINLELQNIDLDIFDENLEKLGIKNVKIEDKKVHLSKWIKRPPATIKFPPVGSAINVKINNKDPRDRIAKGFLASLMCGGNDFQHQNKTALLSAPYVSAGALSVTPENFEKAMVIHAARRIPKANWLNDRDQFMQPQGELSPVFVADCTIWNLFSNSNATAALKDVQYEGDTYQMHNHFFPFLLKEVKKWKITDADIAITLAKAEDTFVATWIANQTLSEEANDILEKAKELYQFYFAHLNQIRTNKFKIETWDAGWWQIKQALADVLLGQKELKELRIAHERLREKLLEQLKAYQMIG